MGLKKYKKLLLMLSVMSAPAIVAEVIDENIANAEYRAGIYYSSGKVANGWVNDGTGTYYFQNGKKYTGYATDTTGKKFFINGKYADGKIGNFTFKNGELVLQNNSGSVSTTPKVTTKNGYVNGLYYRDNQLANWWYYDGIDWYFFQNGKKLTGYGKDNSGQKYFVNGKYANGTYAGKTYKDGLEVTTTVPSKTTSYISGKLYKDGKLASGWVNDGSGDYYFQSGTKHTGYATDTTGKKFFINGKYADGKIGNFTFKNGELVLPGSSTTTPKKEATRTGWYQESGNWYYGNADGTLAKNKWVGDYYLGSTGVMLVNTWTPDGYYVDATGKWVKDKKQTTNPTPTNTTKYISGKLYKDNKLANGWVNDGSGEYYFQNGTKHTGYATDTTGKKFFINGKYAEGKIGSFTFKNGELVLPGSSTTTPKKEATRTGWYQESGNWYYGNADGTLAKNKWVGDYYLGTTGVMLVNTWTPDGYYVDATGKWVKGHTKSAESPNANYSKVIFIDPGHGGADPGASYYGLREKDLTLSVYNKLYAQLQSQGYTVMTSRNTDKYVDFVTERSRLVNQTNADMFISLHFNASGRGAGSSAQGIETYWYQSYAEYPSKINKDMHNDPERLRKSKLLAESVHSNVVASSGAVNRGVQRNTFAVLRETAKPAILIELGYMDNYSESQKIRQSSYQDKLVDGIVKGINKYYSAL